MLLQALGLTKRFGGVVAVDEFSFQINPGEILGLIGPNGAGKTTLINLISGALKPDAGRILFKSLEITNWSPQRRANLGIARTFQIVRALPRLPIIANVLLAGLSSRSRFRGEWIKTLEMRAMEALEYVGLADLAFEQASTLSHGDLKRLELARALMLQPELLLLDEPFAGLNPAETELMARSIQRLRKGGRFGRLHFEGCTILIVEHKLEYLMKIVDRVIVMHQGKLLAEGTPSQIAHDPQTISVYLGEELRA